ncbi:MAG: ActS/PrrB/RegB family redox-sensitive histidine kinase [Hyphomicrobium zavarzinii]|uniref:ActS/PrrB/RegB family redox-sensitive histidine kinase n=1 Tax=Hyphomicrobium zavarzinii TaxID=48292 RepID=UPI001A56770F|nr:ActS/PrrB/RegB family redox-sensitive histidine kinase [Hyphomicrobium zavarzinii]MBL8846312.1 ActS/PrrB/RegB family redox-sensitive histidine kinase [Hyphomicrobium zavarzinii]
MAGNLPKSVEPRLSFDGDSQLRLHTIVRLRWVGVIGQILALSVVYFWLGFDLPAGPCLIVIAVSAWVNVFLAIRYPARHRLSVNFATALLAYDIIQLASLLYLTGGIDNPFTMLIVAPVTVSAATLPLVHTIGLGVLALGCTWVLAFHAMPLPWYVEPPLALPILYKIGILFAVAASMPFLALYVWRLTKEGRQMSTALAATELVLSREQKLHALDGLAAAAAHELGTPLSTITLVTNELARQMDDTNPYREDILLLRSQAQRCREILQKLTRHPPDEDPLHATLTVKEMLHEVAEPYMGGRVAIQIRATPSSSAAGPEARQPTSLRRPGVIYGLGNIIENAADYAGSRVEVNAEWDGQNVVVVIADDGPGFKPEVIDNLGEPYVTTRTAGQKGKSGGKVSGLGLGFFIAKTLLERSGARFSFDNRPAPEHGAVVRIVWPRAAFEAELEGRENHVALPSRRREPPSPGDPISDAI